MVRACGVCRAGFGVHMFAPSLICGSWCALRCCQLAAPSANATAIALCWPGSWRVNRERLPLHALGDICFSSARVVRLLLTAACCLGTRARSRHACDE